MKLFLVVSPLAIAQRLTFGVGILGILGVAVQLGKYAYDSPWARSDWAKFVNLDREMNLPTGYSSLMLAFCALLLGLIARGKQGESDGFWRRWRQLSWIFGFLALDEILSIHEILIIPDVAERLGLPWFLHSMWVIPAMGALGWLSWRFLPFIQHLPRRSRLLFAIAAGIYVGGALGMEMVGSHVAELQGQQHLPYALLAALEEVMEMLGLVAFIYGLLRYLEAWNPEIELDLKLSSRR